MQLLRRAVTAVSSNPCPQGRSAWALPLAAVLALGGLTACEKKDPTEDFLAQGDKYLKVGKYQNAADEYAKALAVKPDDLNLLERRAYAFMQAGQVDDAAEVLIKTVALRPDAKAKGEVYRNVGGMYLRSQTPMSAEPFFLDAVKHDPEDTESLMWLGEIESQRGGARGKGAALVAPNLEKALGYYDQILAKDPGSLLAVVNKRIVVLRLIAHAEGEQATATKLASALRDAAKKKEVQARVEEYATRLEGLKNTSTTLGDRIKELQKQGKTLARAQ